MAEHPTFRIRLSPPVLAAGEEDLTECSWQDESIATLIRSCRERTTESRLIHVTGAPGTGKSRLLVECAAEYSQAFPDRSDRITLLTQSKHSATVMQDLFVRRRQAHDTSSSLSIREPLVRSLHSYAYHLLCRAAILAQVPTPVLLTGADKEAILREILIRHAHKIEQGEATYWPTSLEQSLTTQGFAQELRDILSLVHQRGCAGEDLISLGKIYDDPLWVACGECDKEFEGVMRLRAIPGSQDYQDINPPMDAADLLRQVLLPDTVHEQILQEECQRLDLLLVDDAQLLDAQGVHLINQLRQHAGLTIVVGNSQQNTASYRGADHTQWERWAREPDVDTLALTVNYRSTAPIVSWVDSVARRLDTPAPELVSVTAAASISASAAAPTPDSPEILYAIDAGAEIDCVVSTLRYAHLVRGVPWSDMAIICRTVQPYMGALRRGCHAAGIPISVERTDLPLAQTYPVTSLFAVIELSHPTCPPGRALDALYSAIGGMEMSEGRRLIWALRTYEKNRGGARTEEEILLCLLSEPARQHYREEHPEDDVTSDNDLMDILPSEARGALERIRTVVNAVVVTQNNQAQGMEQVLWQAWQATGLAEQWRSDALSSDDLRSAQGHYYLDAMLALFDEASDFVERHPVASIYRFMTMLRSQEVTTLQRIRPQEERETVTVLSASASAGREWDTVVVMGVQEDTWPNLRIRGSVLHRSELMDRLDGVPANTPIRRIAPLLADERRMFLTALSRARQSLTLTAVCSEDDNAPGPSRFLEELVATHYGGEEPEVRYRSRTLSLRHMIALLRAVVCASAPFPEFLSLFPEYRQLAEEQGTDTAWQHCVTEARQQLARLARAGLQDAVEWNRTRFPSSSTPVVDPSSKAVTITPSSFESLILCPRYWFMQRLVTDRCDTPDATLPARFGTFIHLLLQAEAQGMPSEQVDEICDQQWPVLGIDRPWESALWKKKAADALEHYRAWVSGTKALKLVDTEKRVEAHIPLPQDAGEGPSSVRVVGSIDRIDSDSRGHLVLTDYKTGTRTRTSTDHPQLALYQLALLQGEEGKPPPTIAEAQLYFVVKNKMPTAQKRAQPGFSARQDLAEEWLSKLAVAAAESCGPWFTARQNNSVCDYCPGRSTCPEFVPELRVSSTAARQAEEKQGNDTWGDDE